MIIFPKFSLAKYVFQYVTVQTLQILFHFRRPGFGFQIFLPKELSFFLTANFEFKEGAGTFILPENWIIMCFIKRNAGLHCRLREVCRGHLFWQGSTFLPFMGLVLLDSQIKGSAHSHSKIYSLMGCNSHYVPLITLGKQ